MRKVGTFFLVLIAAGSALASNSSKKAEQEKQQVVAVFESLDRNADQKISKTEASVNRELAQRFAAVDSDADGYLSREEYEARPRAEKFE